MKFLIAPNAFKGTIDADKAASIIGKALLEQRPDAQLVACPIADGGDGTCDLLAKQLNLQRHNLYALNAIGRPILGHIFLNGSQDAAYLDVSIVSGIKGLKMHEKDALLSSTFGTGELIQHAADRGVKQVVLGLGGSATVDMGTGILRALGFLFLDEKGREIPQFSPSFLSKIAHIQRPVQLPDLEFICLCDVRNTFFGEEGAIPVFGPQKGLKPEDLPTHEVAARRLFELMQRKSSFDLTDRPGFGAAGGIALGLSAFFSVRMEAGASFFFDQVGMKEKIRQADYIITGEGRFDSQSSGGKGSYELLQLAKSLGKKTILITSGEEGATSGFYKVIRLPDLDLNAVELKKTAENNLYETVSHFLSSDLATGD
jgi:glycerate kinase